MTDETQDVMLLSVKDVAHRLQIGRTKAYELIDTRELPSVRIGRAVRVKVAELQAYVASLANA
jgi:excisionase family DNA binding protein